MQEPRQKTILRLVINCQRSVATARILSRGIVSGKTFREPGLQIPPTTMYEQIDIGRTSDLE